MKKGILIFLFIILLLVFGAKNVFGQDYPGVCGNGDCEVDLGESCEDCVQDCGQCAEEGWDECGSGTCQDGSTFWIHCSPSCDAEPRTCYSTPSCVWPPENCATGGCPPGQCPPTANCGSDAPVGCGAVICACSGGYCYSDCSACPGPEPSGPPEPTEPPEPPEPPEPSLCIAPTAPNLSSPANGMETPSNLILVWNPVISWGTNPDGNVNTYRAYLDENSDPDTLRCDLDSGTNFCAVSNLELGTTYFWKVIADNGCATAESETWFFTVQAFSSYWFQTQEGDVHAQTNISTNVPSGEVFCLDGDGGTSGVVSYGEVPAFFGEGDLSSTDWLVNTNFSRKPYNYFEDLINKQTTPTELPCDVCSVADIESLDSGIYIKTDSNLRITNTDDGIVNFGDKKIVILIDGSLTLNANIDISDDSGFVAFITKRDINIGGYSLDENGDEPDLEGVFLANNNFDLGTSTNRFIGKGIFFAGSFDMSGRDLGAGNEDTPAAQFIYNPSLWFNAPKEFLVPSYTWEELPPE